jgi:hypothetical protein
MIAISSLGSKAAFAAAKSPSASINKRDATLVLAKIALKNLGLISANFLTSFARAACALTHICMIFAAEKGGKLGSGSGV